MNILKITDFLQHVAHNTQTVDEASVVCFIADHYPLLFFSQLIPHLKRDELPCTALDLKDGDTAAIKAQLASSFLGKKGMYWLGDMSALPAKQQREWIGYVHEYAGPNTLVVCMSSDKLPDRHNWQCITLSDQVDGLLLVQLFALFTSVSAHNAKKIAKQALARYKKISLDQACMLVQYVHLSGGDIDAVSTQLLDKLLVADASLFALSTAFFAQDGSVFFAHWASLKDTYSPQFWVAFWCEQLWRAHWYVQFMKVGKRLDAKKIAYRLPFSFMQKDWRRHDAQRLKEAHAQMYTIDHQLKNGGDAGALDQFYAWFFMQR